MKCCLISSVCMCVLWKAIWVRDQCSRSVRFCCYSHMCGVLLCVFVCVAQNKWLRYAAVGFVISMAKNLTEADIQCILLPSLSPYLHETVIQLEDEVSRVICFLLFHPHRFTVTVCLVISSCHVFPLILDRVLSMFASNVQF